MLPTKWGNFCTRPVININPFRDPYQALPFGHPVASLRIRTPLLLTQSKIMLGELNKDQIESILSSQALGRLACCVNNQPYIVPITYAYDGKYIYGQSNEGKKLEIMRQNPRVCFEVDMMVSMTNWKSVVVNGHFEELSEVEAARAREILFEKVFPLQTSSTVHPHQHEVSSQVDDSNRIKYIMYRIRIDSVSGRFEKQ